MYWAYKVANIFIMIFLFSSIILTFLPEGAESLKPSILPWIKIQATQTFLTSAKRGRQYFDRLDQNLIKPDLC
jgi:hypothetical protein